MKLSLLPNKYKVIRLNVKDIIPEEVYKSGFFSITKTDDELSIVVDDNINIESCSIENNWKALKVEGVLDFSLIGILSKISKILADNGISIFVVSTFNTDYILVKENNLELAKEALISNGYEFI